MARENRLRKKLYLESLEKENRRLKTDQTNSSKILESQAVLINDLRKEIQYLKSVIVNSTDIGTIIRSIQHNTGMLISTSLMDQNLSLSVSKPKQPIARKTAHPWEEEHYPSFPTPESENLRSPQSENEIIDSSQLDESQIADFPDELFENIELDEYMTLDPVSDGTTLLEEHNYTSHEETEDIGVCLHVSRKRVSLEFCPICSDNAQQA